LKYNSNKQLYEAIKTKLLNEVSAEIKLIAPRDYDGETLTELLPLKEKD
tara:strand:- start:4037 stop:4183 length:147 start_codon:yes stop_codon:yes gene_type:complete